MKDVHFFQLYPDSYLVDRIFAPDNFRYLAEEIDQKLGDRNGKISMAEVDLFERSLTDASLPQVRPGAPRDSLRSNVPILRRAIERAQSRSLPEDVGDAAVGGLGALVMSPFLLFSAWRSWLDWTKHR